MERTLIPPKQQLQQSFLLYGQECFAGKYTTRKIHMKLHQRPKWCIFYVLTSEDIDDVISHFFPKQSMQNRE